MDLKLVLISFVLVLSMFIIKSIYLRWYWIFFIVINVVFFELQQNWFFIITWMFLLVVNIGLLIAEITFRINVRRN